MKAILSVMLIACLFAACKKENQPSNIQVENTYWSGWFTYQNTRYAQMLHFLPGNSFEFFQSDGQKYSGTCSITGKEVVLTYSNSGLKVTGNVNDTTITFGIASNPAFIIEPASKIKDPDVNIVGKAWQLNIAGNSPTFYGNLVVINNQELLFNANTLPYSRTKGAISFLNGSILNYYILYKSQFLIGSIKGGTPGSTAITGNPN